MAYGGLMGASAPGTYTTDEILSDATKVEYGLGNDAVPNDVFGLLSNSFSKNKFFTARYTGNDTNRLPVTIESQPIFFSIIQYKNQIGFYGSIAIGISLSQDININTTGNIYFNVQGAQQTIIHYSPSNKAIYTLTSGDLDNVNSRSLQYIIFAILS